MKKIPLCAPPDPYTLAPLTALLPIEGSVRRIESFASSLYARLEKVQAQQKEGAVESGQPKRANAEILMLRQILEWLSSQKEDGGSSEG